MARTRKRLPMQRFIELGTVVSNLHNRLTNALCETSEPGVCKAIIALLGAVDVFRNKMDRETCKRVPAPADPRMLATRVFYNGGGRLTDAEVQELYRIDAETQLAGVVHRLPGEGDSKP